MHARILHHLFHIINTDVIKAPLWDVATLGPAAFPNNAAFVHQHVSQLLSTSFPNLLPQQVEVRRHPRWAPGCLSGPLNDAEHLQVRSLFVGPQTPAPLSDARHVLGLRHCHPWLCMMIMDRPMACWPSRWWNTWQYVRGAPPFLSQIWLWRISVFVTAIGVGRTSHCRSTRRSWEA